MMANRKTLIIGGVAAAILAGIGIVLAAYLGRDVEDEAAQAHRNDALEIAGAKIAVTNRMPSAQSVEFGQVFVHWEGEVPSVCGRVDIRQAQDEFDGEERYVFSEGVLTLEEADGSDAVSQKWSDVCE